MLRSSQLCWKAFPFHAMGSEMGDSNSPWWQRGSCEDNHISCRWHQTFEEEKTTQLEEPDPGGSADWQRCSTLPRCNLT